MVDKHPSFWCDHVREYNAPLFDHTFLADCLQAKQTAIQECINRGKPADDIKSASGQIFIELKRILSLTQCGNNKCAFLRDTLTPLVTDDTTIYNELENEIF